MANIVEYQTLLGFVSLACGFFVYLYSPMGRDGVSVNLTTESSIEV